MLWSFLTGEYSEDEENRQERLINTNSSRKRRRKISIWRDRMVWWFQDEVLIGWGTKSEWVFAVCWTVWLCLLAAHSSDHVYIKLVRHLGVMAVSQLPTCTLLALKSHWSPFQAFLKLSHEELDPYHRALGRIIIILSTLHGVLYIQFFLAHHVIPEAGKAYVVVVGLSAVCALWVLGICSISKVRKRSYRVFYGFHHAMFIAIMLCLFIHVAVARPFVLESVLIYLMNQLLRSTNTKSLAAELNFNNDSNVLKISIAIPSDSRDYPAGSSVNISTGSRHWLQKFCSGYFSNPFTITYERSTGMFTIYLKTRGKRTKALATLPKQTIMSVEGPYGKASTYEASLPGYLIGHADRVLLVAGGVGATFVFSVAHGLLERIQEKQIKNLRKFLTVVWVVRNEDDIARADSILQRGNKDSDTAVLADVTTLYFSQPSWNDVNPDAEPELFDLVEDPNEDQPLRPLVKSESDADHTGVEKPQFGRPSFKEIVEDFLGDMAAEKTAAVAVCGPLSLRKDLRRAVGCHVQKGAKVWWHEEKFGQ
ncbi:hypothetical protein B0O99DRAFT_530256 [Bisporella sp. PMI_857]|nr:hypothetical protein B0O99DRAFT_530256 [Bisporella sp. PMI_857]